MPYDFLATDDTVRSFSDIDLLINYATIERDNGHEDRRKLFLKLAIVSSVTKFQVFIESVLKEYLYHLKSCQKNYSEVSIHLRLNALKLYTSSTIIHKNLENPEGYNRDKLTEVKRYADQALKICNDNLIIADEITIETKFPMGKTGLSELSKLFRQINGEDIFANPPFDINRLNEILGRRHAIVHEDSNPQVTEQTVQNYRNYLVLVIEYVDQYLANYK
ncbi:HEPN domain-containing protein [Mucilaginibacter sp. SJ]|uniref:HEPN domain-containing protein n=1 Tax=Mucilaginibacter sp. SJ TaxID=3029053 RepID=UPI0023A9C1A6|nr:HEPN domain-containing protein [Mucilaginibacter sp. SJ]WEA00735.1 HEPN domain-containing protein [Mucilaginibacter sp. SJ]